MYEQATGTPGPAFGYAAPAQPPPLPRSSTAAFELRPLSTGEILDRTFALYRQRFWLYCGLAAIAAAFGTLVQLGQMMYMGGIMGTAQQKVPVQPTAASIKVLLIGMVVTIAASLFHFFAYSLTQAATVSAVSSIYLGHETSMSIAFKAVRGKWYRFAGIAFWQGWSAIWIFMLLIIPAFVVITLGASRGGGAALTVVGVILMILALLSLIYGIIAYLRNSLAIAASVFEKLKIRPSMRRSKTLAAGLKWRLFLVLLMMTVLSSVAGGLLFPFALFAQHSHALTKLLSEGAELLLTFVTQSLIGPLGAIAFCLFYFDSRVRKEGFDIEALMDRSLGSPLTASPPPAWQPQNGFAPSGFTAEQPASPFPPSPFTAAPASPFAPSEFTAASTPFAPTGFTQATPAPRLPEADSKTAAEQE